MSWRSGRYTGADAPTAIEGWSIERLTPPSRVFGANGLRTGADGRIYIAQVSGSQISALDLHTGKIEIVSPMGGDIIGPDDLAFDSRGNLYATEVMDGRVSVRDANGSTHVLRGDLPGANGITVAQDRLFVDEFRHGGRLVELSLDGAAPRLIAENLPLPNALAQGPDGLLYFPLLGANEIWRVHPDGGTPERVIGDLGTPVAVKFDTQGYIVSPQVHSGEVLRIDPRTGERVLLAALDPGLDNLTFVGERLFVSNINGRIIEILANGERRTVLPLGLNGPLGLAFGADGLLYVADGTVLYALPPGDTLQPVGMLFSSGFPGFLRGLAPLLDGGFAVTTSNGQAALYWPHLGTSEVVADALDRPYGIAVSTNGALAVAEFGAGRVLAIREHDIDVLASGLRQPTGMLFGMFGECIVSEAGAGRIVQIHDGRVETIVDGLVRPQSVAMHEATLYIVDAGAKALIAFDMASGSRQTVAGNLPIGAPPGVTPKPLRGLAPFSGPQGPFAGLVAAEDGTLYLSADGDGSVLALHHHW